MPQYKAAAPVFQKAEVVVGAGWVGVCFSYLGGHHNANIVFLTTEGGYVRVPWVIVVIAVSFFANRYGLPLLPIPDWVGYLVCAFLAMAGMSLAVLGVKATSPRVLIGSDRSTLVTGGIYSYIRNPICLSCILLSFGVAMGFKSIIGMIAAILVLAIVYLRIALWEERELKRRFGQEYCDYKSKVGMFIPRLPRTANK